MLYHYGRSGTTYLYIHLNNDLTPRNDNKGGCVKDVTFAVPERREGDRRPADRVERRLGRRERQPAPPLRGPPERRGRREPVQVPEAREKPLFAARQGSVFSLGLRGTLVAAGAGSGDARGRPRTPVPGRSLARRSTPREVELTVPLGADVAPALDQLAGATLRTLKTPMPVAAFTLKANTTPEAILGAPGALVLGRVAPTP